jgi:hypothetical protein
MVLALAFFACLKRASLAGCGLLLSSGVPVPVPPLEQRERLALVVGAAHDGVAVLVDRSLETGYPGRPGRLLTSLCQLRSPSVI